VRAGGHAAVQRVTSAPVAHHLEDVNALVGVRVLEERAIHRIGIERSGGLS